MKKRSGFVSNSSSSSYFVAYKGDLKEELVRVFSVPEKHPLRSLCKQVMTWFEHADLTYRPDEPIEDGRRYVDCFRSRAFEKGMSVNVYHASSEVYDGIESWLCYNVLEYEDDRLWICGGGGY